MSYANKLYELSYGDKFAHYTDENQRVGFIVLYETEDKELVGNFTRSCCLDSETNNYKPGKIYYIHKNSDIILEN